MEKSNMAKTRTDRTYLNCPYDDKDDAKALGAKWDPDMKKWFVPAGNDITPFDAWLPQSMKGSVGGEPKTPFLG
jgi:hypothetical protein